LVSAGRGGLLRSLDCPLAGYCEHHRNDDTDEVLEKCDGGRFALSKAPFISGLIDARIWIASSDRRAALGSAFDASYDRIDRCARELVGLIQDTY
jgi:hypothetical protein